MCSNEMKSFYDAIDLPYDDGSEVIRPELKQEIDIGDGTGGMYTILHLIYSGLFLQEEHQLGLHKNKHKKRKSHHHGSKIHHKDATELKKYEK